MAKSSTPRLAPGSSRTLWKGAISFGLIHVPIGLYSATTRSGIDFDWLDKRTMDPVGYKRINKKTGKEVAMDDIVKGIAYEEGRYVVLTPKEIAAAYPKITRTIEIEAFVPIDEIPFIYLERPYYTAPIQRGERVYALLRDTLADSRRAGVGKVVISEKQHLAVLMPCGPALVLNLLRWGGEIRSWEALKLPPTAKALGIKAAEMTMARQLIESMSTDWNADAFRDSFTEEVMKLVETKARAGDLHEVEAEGRAPAPAASNVVDLTELLRRSLTGGGTPRKAAAKKAPARRKAAPAKSRRARRAA